MNTRTSSSQKPQPDPADPLAVERPSWLIDELGSPTGNGVRVGVIDSGWDRTLSHAHVEKGIGFVDPDDDLAVLTTDDDRDRIGHGTACTDLITRLAPEARIVPLRVFGQRLETSPATIERAIRCAVERELHVVNVSLGTLRTDAMRALYVACEWARQNGVILVAATHNRNAWSYPALFDNVISVGIGPVEQPFEYYYRRGKGVECLAQGHGQRVRWLEGHVVEKSGTSFAAPIITGIVALFLERYPAATLEDIRTLLATYALHHEPLPVTDPDTPAE